MKQLLVFISKLDVIHADDDQSFIISYELSYFNVCKIFICMFTKKITVIAHKNLSLVSRPKP